MERTTWTDERLDDMSGEVRELRRETRNEFTEMRREMRDGFDFTNRRIDTLGTELRSEIEALRLTILRVGGGMMIGLVGVIAAILARGV
jgi:hypothetical protein